MNSLRIASGAALLCLFLTQLGCPLEPDPKSIEECKIGEKRCLSNTRTDECGEDGRWKGAETFVCPPPGMCQVMGNEPICM